MSRKLQILENMLKMTFLILMLMGSLQPLLAASEVQPISEATELLDSIIAVQATFNNASGKITYKIVYTKDKDRSAEVYQAKLNVEVPNKYNFMLKKEDQIEHFISDGIIEWHVEDIDGFKIASKKDLKNGKGKFAGITDFIPLRREELQKHFHMKASLVAPDNAIEGAHSLLELEPITADQKDHIKWSKIYFDKASKACCIQILDADGNLYDIKIEKMDYNTKLNDDLFTYTEEE